MVALQQMRSRRSVVGRLSAALLAAIVAGTVGAFGAPVTKSFTFSVSLEVDGHSITGSAVWDMRSEEKSTVFGNALPFDNIARGEAIAIPLSDDTVLFVLKRARNYVSSRSYGAFLRQCGPISIEELEGFRGGCEIRDFPEIVVATGDIHGNRIPDLTILKDGEAGSMNISVEQLRVQVTDDARTSGLLHLYPWIRELPTGVSNSIRGHPTEGFLRSELYLIDFISE